MAVQLELAQVGLQISTTLDKKMKILCGQLSASTATATEKDVTTLQLCSSGHCSEMCQANLSKLSAALAMSLADTITSIVVCRGPRPLKLSCRDLVNYPERILVIQYLVKSDISIIIVHISLARTTMSLLLTSHLLTSLSSLIEVRQ